MSVGSGRIAMMDEGGPMDDSRARTHIVMVVDNEVTGDGRVIRSARSAAKAGYRVTVVGINRRTGIGSAAIDGLTVLRFPVEYTLFDGSRARDAAYVAKAMRRAEVRLARHRVHKLEAPRYRDSAVARLWKTAVRKTSGLLTRSTQQHALSAQERGTSRLAGLRSYTERQVAWRLPGLMFPRTGALLFDFERALVDGVVALEPDILHVHDAALLPMATTAAAHLDRAGRPTAVVYDAHEWWRGRRDSSSQQLGIRDAEARYARRADAVVAVNSRIADQHRADAGERPIVVVPNGPSSDVLPAQDRLDARSELGLSPETPLLVYSGGVNRERGVEDVIDALALMPDVHLLIVCNAPARRVAELTERSVSAGVDLRVHVRPYVEAASVPWYVASADIGLCPLRRTPNHDSAIATKLAEYTIAGLPLVVSDCPAQAEFVRHHGVGEVHRAGDPADIAAAVQRALAQRAAGEYQASPEFVGSLTWEAHEHHLWEVYASLAVQHVPAPARARVGIRAVSGTNAPGRLIARRGDGVIALDRARSAADGSARVRHVGELDVVVLEGSAPLLGPLTTDLEAEIQLLAHLGPTVVAVAAGTDIAGPFDFEELSPEADAAQWGKRRRRHHQDVADACKAAFTALGERALVLDLEHLGRLPAASWIPRSSAPEAFERPVPETDRTEPLRVHVGVDHESPRWIAATATLAGLAAEGRLVLVDSISAAQVVVGDVANGGYRDFEVEALASGRVVVGHVDDAARRVLPSIPIVEADMESIGEAVRSLADDRTRLAELALESREFARTWHDGTLSDRVLDDAIAGRVVETRELRPQ